MAEYRDPTPISPTNPEYDPSDADPRVLNYTKQTREKIYGVDVRETMARTAEISSIVSNEAKDKAEEAIDVTEQLIDGSFDEGVLNTEIEKRLNELETEYAPRLTEAEHSIDSHIADENNPHHITPEKIGADLGRYFDVRSYDGDIQNALTACYNAGGGVVYVPDGLYNLDKTLEIYENTHLVLSQNVVLNKTTAFSPMILNGRKGADNFKGYNGHGNIVIEGGTINGNGGTHQVRASEIMIAHAENITIKDVVFLDNYDSHFIELNSTKNARILNNTFKGQSQDETQSRYPEMVQIDLATADGFPHFGEADNTPCQDIFIRGNYFENGIRGIGTHSAVAGEDHVHKRINISNNIFKNMDAQCIRAMDWWISSITSNIMEYVGSGIEVRAEENPVHYINVSNNNIKNTNRLEGILFTNNVEKGVNIYNCIIEGNIIAHVRGNGRAIYARNITDSIVSNNKINSPLVDGIFIRDAGSRVTIKSNQIYNAGREGIYCYNGTYRVIVEGNLIQGSGRNGIQVNSSSDALIANNLVWFAHGDNDEGGHCIFVSSGSSYTSVTGNKIIGVSTGSYLIAVSGESHYALIANNHTRSGNSYGIWTTSTCSTPFITGNLCVGQKIRAGHETALVTNNRET